MEIPGKLSIFCQIAFRGTWHLVFDLPDTWPQFEPHPWIEVVILHTTVPWGWSGKLSARRYEVTCIIHMGIYPYPHGDVLVVVAHTEPGLCLLTGFSSAYRYSSAYGYIRSLSNNGYVYVCVTVFAQYPRKDINIEDTDDWYPLFFYSGSISRNRTYEGWGIQELSKNLFNYLAILW